MAPKAERVKRAVKAVTEINPAAAITKLPPVITKSPVMITKVGRPPIGAKAMSGYERLKRHRAKVRAANV
jgi:hypothetical protein